MRFVVLLGWLLCFPAIAQTTVAGFTPGSFRVTESGAAEYRIPLRVPPGIAGMEPKLALVYNSQAGNGLVGVGWTLEGLSSITRCPRTMAQDGAKGGVNYDANDRFCLDGQRLMAVNGMYGADGTEYRTERETFTKVVSYGIAGNGPAWFKAWTKSGQMLEYGSTADSRIEAQGKTTVRVWAVNKVSDTKGNYLTVSYTEDNANGEFYPLRIDYTGQHASGSTPSSSVRLSLETRLDVRQGFAGSSVVRSRMLLTKVGLFTGEANVREYRLSYQSGPVSRRSRLSSVTECAPGSCLAPVDLAWNNGGGGFSAVQNTVQIHPGNWTAANAALSVGDFNGDGYTDILVHHAWGNYFCSGPKLASAAVFDGCVQFDTGNWTAANAALSVGDFNGDGYADVLVHHAWGNYFCSGPKLMSPAVFDGCVQFDTGNWTASNAALSVGDFNGDGYADILVHHAWGNYFCSGPKLMSAAVFDGCVKYDTGNWTRSNAALSVGDFNGDGYADILVHHAWGNYFCSGPKLMSPAVFDGCVRFDNGNWTSSNAALSVADFNADGYTDVLVHHAWGNYFCAGPLLTSPATFDGCVLVDSGNWTDANAARSVGDFDGDGHPDVFVHHSTGNHFCPGALLTSPSTFNCVQVDSGNWFYSNAKVSAGDFNGDGNTDLVVSHAWASYFANGGIGTPDTLSSVGNSTLTAISYAPLTDTAIYTKASGAAYPFVDVVPRSSVVAWAGTTNGIGGTSVSSRRYGGFRIDLSGRGSLGFGWQEATDQSTGLKVRTENRQDWPYVGMPSLVRKTQSSGAVLSQVTNHYECLSSVDESVCFPFVWFSVESGNDLNGAALPTVLSITFYDGFGNPTLSSVTTADGQSKVTTNVYVNDTVNWLLGLLTRSTVQSTGP